MNDPMNQAACAFALVFSFTVYSILGRLSHGITMFSIYASVFTLLFAIGVFVVTIAKDYHKRQKEEEETEE